MNEYLTDPKWWLVAISVCGGIWAVTNRMLKAHRWWVNHGNSHDRIKDALDEIKEDIKALMRGKPDVVEQGSPLRLNDLGAKVSMFVDAKRLAIKLADEVVQQVPSDNPYDIQDWCKRYFAQEYEPSPELMDTFKRCAFEHGIALAQVQHVCAMELRDGLLERNKRDPKQGNLPVAR